MSFPLCANSRVRDALSRLINRRTLPHAIIIEGETGTGKHTLASYVAKSALCEDKNSPCGSCRSCHLADAGTHPDISRIAPEDKKKNISVDQIDLLRENAYYTPRLASGKVFIIEQASTMNASAQNKLLKVLEEPPQNVFFILLTESANALLETIVSRCTVFSLYAPDFETAVLELQKRGIDKSTAEELLFDCKNNIGKALSTSGKNKIGIGINTAREYLKFIEQGDYLSALTVAAALDKDRPAVNDFVLEIKDILINKIKSDFRFRGTRLECTKMYDAICEFETLLITNINLSLFFTSLTSRFREIKNK